MFICVFARAIPMRLQRFLCHRLQLRKEKEKKDEGAVKVSKAFKIYIVGSELVGFILVVLGLIIYGSDYNAGAALYAVAFFLLICPVIVFLRRFFTPPI